MSVKPIVSVWLRDGRVIETHRQPRQDKHEKGKFIFTLDNGDVINVTPDKKVDGAWAEEGFEGRPPQQGDKVLLSNGTSEVVLDSDQMESLARPQVWLVSLPSGLTWIHGPTILPLWREAPGWAA